MCDKERVRHTYIIPDPPQLTHDGAINPFALFTEIVPARYVLAILGSIGMAIVYGLKVNLSVAMVAMVNHAEVHRLQLLHSNHSILSNVTTTETVEECTPPGGAQNVTTKNDVSQVLQLQTSTTHSIFFST